MDKVIRKILQQGTILVKSNRLENAFCMKGVVDESKKITGFGVELNKDKNY